MNIIQTLRRHNYITIFLILSLISFCIRVYINFSYDLLIGNGGYYPLQVRTILERGELAFPDMPLLFYLNAGIIKLISFGGVTITDSLIITVVQIVDSISIPLLLVPIYHLLKLTKNSQFSYFIVATGAFSVLTIYTLMLTSTSQKNALGITLFVFSLYWFIRFIKSDGQRKLLILALIFLLLTGLTHFGTFVFAIITGTLFIVFKHRSRAILPIFLMLASCLFLIYWLDPTRFFRLFSIVDELFKVMPPPGQLILMVVYDIMALFFIRGLKKYKDNFDEADKTFIKTFITLLILIPLPIINPQYIGRLSTFLFIPLVCLLLFFAPVITNLAKKVLGGLQSLVVLASMLFSLVIGFPQSLSKEALKDLQQINLVISDSDNTVIVTRHNLEFWVAWTLRVDVSQESKFDSVLVKDYDHIFILNQTKGFDHRGGPPDGRGRSHFDEPIVPSGSLIVDSSKFFKLYQYK